MEVKHAVLPIRTAFEKFHRKGNKEDKKLLEVLDAELEIQNIFDDNRLAVHPHEVEQASPPSRRRDAGEVGTARERS